MQRSIWQAEPPGVLAATHQVEVATLVRAAVTAAGYRLCGEYAELDSALSAAARLRPEVCVLDDALTRNPASAVTAVKGGSPGTRIVIVSAELSEAACTEAMRAGARGYVSASAPPAGLARALGDVLAGEVAVPRRLVRSLVVEFVATS
jgi:DNA-binding NarL/FixJ family response regulator